MSEKIDASAEAAAQLEAWFTDAKQTAADLLDALVADRNSLRSKLAEAERERDRLQSVVLGKIDEQDDLVERLNDAEVERDAALSELAKLRKQIDDENERKGDDDTFW